MNRPNTPFSALSWSEIRRRLADMIANDPSMSDRTITFAPNDEVRGHAREALGMIRGAYDWDSATARTLRAETERMVRPIFHGPNDGPVSHLSDPGQPGVQ